MFGNVSPLIEGANQLHKKPVSRQIKYSSPDNREWRGLKRTRLRKLGKKGKQWVSIRAELKKRFEAAGITTCEIQYAGCWRDNGLGFCHSKKRRNCSEADLWIVILGCNRCHDILETRPHAEMEKIVLEIISERQKQP